MYGPPQWRNMPSKRAGSCDRCKKPFPAGDLIWWHPKLGVKCVPCYQGKDPEERRLTEEDKRDIQKARDRLSSLDSLPKPLKPHLQQEYDELVEKLENFAQVKSVRSFLGRMTGEVPILGSNGTGNGSPKAHTTKAPRNCDNTLYGMKDALEKERQAPTYAKCRIQQVEPHEELFTLTLAPGSAIRLLEVQEGWSVAGERYGGAYSWTGEIIDIDLHEPVHIVITVNASSTGRPRSGGEIYFYRPDFQRILRSWLEERIQLKKGLPERYNQLLSGSFAVNTSLPGVNRAEAAKLGLRSAQLDALDLMSKPLGMVWGPPGTGKTFTLGAMLALSRLNRKIIVLAPTNAAADQAALAIDNARTLLKQNLSPGELIRPGHPKLAEIEKRPHLLAWSEKQKDISRQIARIGDKRRRLEKQRESAQEPLRTQLTKDIGKLKEEEKTLKEGRSRELWRLANEAKIIVCTLHSLLYNEPVLEGIKEQHITLVLDEASMVPRCMFARIMDFNVVQVLLFGDFKQLSPVRLCEDEHDENSKYWIGDSAFDVVGLRDDNDVVRLERNKTLVMLTQQNRMHTGICEIVSRHFYRGKLTTVGEPPAPPIIPEVPAKNIILVERRLAPPVPHDFDSDNMKNACIPSAWLAVSIASRIIEVKPAVSVLLLTPFRNQAYMLRKLAGGELPVEANWKAGTVHVSQGQEADIVIFCPVDPAHPWLKGQYGASELERLLCVAFSRARTHVLVVASLTEIRYSPLLERLCLGAARWQPTQLPMIAL